ncbi:MAG: magnesium transporter [Gemmatimonadetes bacterium]|nr:magnesium transporter [Gemmatimonadota bacterium]
MLKDLLKPEILDLIEAHRWTDLRDVLADWPAPEIADLVLHLRKEDRVLLFRALPRGTATDVFSHLELEQQDDLLRDLTDEETRHLLADLPPDDRTHLLEELPGQATQRMLNLLGPADLKEARWLLGYPEESVGRLMTPDYVAVRPEWSVREALSHIRVQGKDSETINRIFVTDERWYLLDDIELRHFILAPPNATVADIMDQSVVSVSAFAHREEAVNAIRRYDQFVLPVVDSDGVLVGIVTVDDVLDVQEEETTEDFHRVASVGPVRMSLREAPFQVLYRARIGWLLVLVFMNIFSGAGIAAFEETIQAVVALVFFLPLLIDSGGNAGSQSATLMIRAMATGDVRMGDWFKLLSKELAVALAIGLTMAVGVSMIAYFRAPEVIAVVAITMTIIVLVGSLIGMSLPFVFTRLGWDPATASAPLITSLADISGVMIYFSIATWYLGIGG